MDVNPRDEQNVLLVQEKGSDKMNVVAGLDNEGKPKTVVPKQENEPDFLKLDKHSNVLENFLSNFMRQAKDPTHFGFFKVPAENIETNAQILSEMSQKGDVGKEFLKEYQVDTTPFQVAEQQTQGEAKQEYKPIDESRVDWKLLEQFGVTRETLEKTNSLDAMLNWRKSPALIAISPKIDDVPLHTQARLSFREAPDGRIVPIVHALQKEPQLERELFGHSNRHSQSEGGIRIPNKLGGVDLSEKEQTTLKEGGVIYVKGMIDKKGQSYNAYVKVNNEKEKLDFFKWNPQKKQGVTPITIDVVASRFNSKTDVPLNAWNAIAESYRAFC